MRAQTFKKSIEQTKKIPKSMNTELLTALGRARNRLNTLPRIKTLTQRKGLR